MEFRKNLEAIREINKDPEESQPEVGQTKEAINQLLFQIMPPKTTLAEMEDLACAIFQTVSDAWSSVPIERTRQALKNINREVAKQVHAAFED